MALTLTRQLHREQAVVLDEGLGKRAGRLRLDAPPSAVVAPNVHLLALACRFSAGEGFKHGLCNCHLRPATRVEGLHAKAVWVDLLAAFNQRYLVDLHITLLLRFLRPLDHVFFGPDLWPGLRLKCFEGINKRLARALLETSLVRLYLRPAPVLACRLLPTRIVLVNAV